MSVANGPIFQFPYCVGKFNTVGFEIKLRINISIPVLRGEVQPSRTFFRMWTENFNSRTAWGSSTYVWHAILRFKWISIPVLRGEVQQGASSLAEIYGHFNSRTAWGSSTITTLGQRSDPKISIPVLRGEVQRGWMGAGINFLDQFQFPYCVGKFNACNGMNPTTATLFQFPYCVGKFNRVRV